MKTPGHAMTAQAGAEECDECGMMCSPNEYHPYAACLMFKGCQRGDIVRANLPTPPAAVPVEALEGLVAELMARVEADKAKCTNDDGSYRSDAHRAAWNFADGLEHAADKIYELIKERSNG